MFSECPYPHLNGNGHCDEKNNLPYCNFDGGDCINKEPAHPPVHVEPKAHFEDKIADVIADALAKALPSDSEPKSKWDSKKWKDLKKKKMDMQKKLTTTDTPKIE